jgi:hypothetical protein
VKTKPDKILQLGTSKAKNYPRIRNLIYIQSDLPRNLVDALKAAYESSNGEKISLKNSGAKDIKEKNSPIGPVPMDEDSNDEDYEDDENKRPLKKFRSSSSNVSIRSSFSFVLLALEVIGFFGFLTLETFALCAISFPEIISLFFFIVLPSRIHLDRDHIEL